MTSATPLTGRADYDLVVIGGGPAGTSAAITAARSGARILLLERGRFPRQRVCGEFVSAESLDLVDRLLTCATAHVAKASLRVPQARVFVDGHVITVPVAPAAASIARFDLDSALWQAARDCGVDARLQVQVDQISGSGPFRLATSAGEVNARAAVCAAGRWSNLSPKRNQGNGDTREKWLGVKAHFSEESPPLSVDLYFFEGGYCGVQPVRLAGGADGRINACAMVRADVARTLPEVFRQNRQLAERSSKWQALTEAVSTSPLAFHEPRPVQEGMLLAGDAAGFVDPFVGDGISLALRGGAMAAECLIPFLSNQISLAEATARYVGTYERRLAPVFRNSSKIRQLLKLPRPVRNSIEYVLQRSPVLTRYLVSMTR